MAGLSLVLTKGFGDISWTCTASILQRNKGEAISKVRILARWGQARVCLTQEDEATSHP